MQLQDAFSIPKIFIGLDIHKKSWTVSIQTDLFFSQDLFDASLMLRICINMERTFPDHAVDLVYEGCCGFARHDIFNLGWNVLVVNPSDVKRGDKERYQKKQMP
jgi:hypothetical protein